VRDGFVQGECPCPEDTDVITFPVDDARWYLPSPGGMVSQVHPPSCGCDPFANRLCSHYSGIRQRSRVHTPCGRHGLRGAFAGSTRRSADQDAHGLDRSKLPPAGPWPDRCGACGEASMLKSPGSREVSICGGRPERHRYGLSCRGTTSSNPSPSSGESCELSRTRASTNQRPRLHVSPGGAANVLAYDH